MNRLKPFQYHIVSTAVAEEMALIRSWYASIAEQIIRLCPENREKSLAITALEDSLMRAVQSLALTGKAVPFNTVHSGAPE